MTSGTRALSALVAGALAAGAFLATAVLISGCSGSGETTETPVPGDMDGDGYSPDGGDCNDSNVFVSPEGTETCNGLDDNCDGSVDPDCDADEDGQLSANSGGTDCDDTNASTYLGAPELCDGQDNNCDTLVDNVPDGDGDGFKRCGVEGEVDCNDGDSAVYPGAAEVFDGVPNDCADTGPQETLSASAARASLVGEYAGDSAGLTIVAAGDLNGDGYSDLAVGAPLANAGTNGSSNGNEESDSGKVYLLFGGPSFQLGNAGAGLTETVDLSYADTTLTGVAAGDHAGSYLARLGDVNGDGLDDLWVGAPGAGAGSGRGYVLKGRASWPPLLSLAESDRILDGTSSTAALGPGAGGDVNHDDFGDLLVGAPGENGDTGAVYLLYGGESFFTTTTTNGEGQTIPLEWTDTAIRLAGTDPGGRLGQAVASNADLQGDGIDDMFLAAPGVSKVYILLGRSDEWTPSLAQASVTLTGELGEGAGLALDARGDVNHDGYADIVVGAPMASSLGGKVYVIFGKPSGLAVTVPLSNADLVISGEAASGLGASVSAGGDVNGDGLDDLSVGAPGAAQAFLVAGTPASLPYASGSATSLAQAAFAGPAGTLTGASVQLCGDLNRDGLHEWAIGAPGDDQGGQDAGLVYLFFGHP